jgi:hypothetical protein
MANTCSICRHPKRNQIEASAIAGESLRNIAKQRKVGYGAVNRHLKQCLPSIAPQVVTHLAKQNESSVASVREVLEILSFQARADVTDLFAEDGSFDVEDLRSRGLGRMLKTLTFRQELDGSTIVKAEAYSAQGAAQALLNAYTKLEITKQLTDAKRLTDRERTDRLAAIFDKARERASRADTKEQNP